MWIDETFARRKELAERATPGPWTGHHGDPNYVDGSICCGDKYLAKCNLCLWPDRCEIINPEEQRANTLHIAANSPDVILADINEIERLLYKLNRLEKEVDWLISTKIVEEWNGRFVGAPNKDNSGYAVYPTKAEAVASWREAARKAVETSHEN